MTWGVLHVSSQMELLQRESAESVCDLPKSSFIRTTQLQRMLWTGQAFKILNRGYSCLD